MASARRGRLTPVLSKAQDALPTNTAVEMDLDDFSDRLCNSGLGVVEGFCMKCCRGV